MIQCEFEDSKGPKPVGFSHGDFGFVVQALNDTAGELLLGFEVADEWVTQLLRQGDAKVFKKYSQMKLQMKREALQKMNRKANEDGPGFDTVRPN